MQLSQNENNPPASEVRATFDFAQTFAHEMFSADGPLRIQLIRSASGSDESGYFIFLAGGNNLERQFFAAERITAIAGKFEPGIYLVYDHAGGPIILPTHKIKPSLLEKAWFRHGRKQSEELALIKSSLEQFFACHYTRD